MGHQLILAFLVAAASPPAQSLLRPLSESERQLFIDGIKGQLKDPDSAKFKWAPLIIKSKSKPTPTGHTFDIGLYCGMVNAKNSFGGFTGFLPFASQIAVVDDKVKLIEVRDIVIANDENAVRLAKLCIKRTGFNPADAN